MKVSKTFALTLMIAFAAAPAIAAPTAELQLAWHDDGPHPNWPGQGKKNWKKYSDCHRSPDRHYVKGYGRVLHRHVGPNCRVQVMKQWKTKRNNNCLRLGDFWICP